MTEVITRFSSASMVRLKCTECFQAGNSSSTIFTRFLKWPQCSCLLWHDLQFSEPLSWILMWIWSFFADHALPSEHEEDLNVFQKKTSGVISYVILIISFWLVLLPPANNPPPKEMPDKSTQPWPVKNENCLSINFLCFPVPGGRFIKTVFAFAAYTVCWCWVQNVRNT